MTEINNNDYQLIESFFDCTLDTNELNTFEQRLKSDIAFKKQVELYDYAKNKVLSLYHPQIESQQDAFRNKLNNLKKQSQTNHRQRQIIKILAIAATVLLLFFISVSQFGNPPIKDYHTIAVYYADNINTDFISEQSRAIEFEKPSSTQQILIARNNKNYKSILDLCNDIPDRQLTDVLKLIKGNALLHLNRGAEAIPYFEEVVRNKGSQINIALWSLATIHLEQKPMDKKQARTYLNQIISEGFNSKEDAQRVLDALD